MSGEVTCLVDINDSDILRIEEGPIRWARAQQFKRMDLDAFRRDLIDKFAQVGFKADVLVYSTDAGPDVFAFDMVIQDRLDGEFDPDRQVHEVVNNILELPDQDKGWIKTDESLLAAERAMRENPHRH